MLTALTVLLVSEPVEAQSDFDVCLGDSTDETRDRNIAACTKVIQNPKTSRAIKAIAYQSRCLELSTKGDFKRAIADCNEAIAIEPNGSGYYSRGIAYRGIGDIKRARADYEKAASMGHDVARRELRKLGK